MRGFFSCNILINIYNCNVNLVRAMEDISVEYPMKQKTARFFSCNISHIDILESLTPSKPLTQADCGGFLFFLQYFNK